VPAPAWRTWDWILLAGMLLWTFLSLCYPLMDTDFWWHLRTGELILQDGRVPQVDWYTFVDLDHPPAWIDLHWGFQVLITFLYRWGGASLIILVKAVVITLAVAVAWFAGGRDLPVRARVAVWILPIICISGRGYERPEMLSQLFLAGWLWMTRQVELRPHWIWLLPVIQVVWVNCHALFVLGLVVGACYAADCVVRDLAAGRWGLAPPSAAPTARAIVWVAGLVALACLVNPYFEEGAFFPAQLYRKFSAEQEIYSTIGEFQRPIDFLRRWGWQGISNPYLLAEITLWCVTAASFVLLLWRKRRWSVLRLLLFAGFSHLAWKATRNSNIFAIVAGFAACENLGEAFATVATSVAAPRSVPRDWCLAAILAALIAGVVTGYWNEMGDKNKPFGLGEARDWFIHDAAKFAGREGFPHRAFVANNGQAAVYIYHNAPDRRVFMDGRLEVCSLESWLVFNAILGKMVEADSEWQMTFQQHGGELPVVILDNRFSILQTAGLLETPGWRLVYSDRVAAVFLSDGQADALSLRRVDLDSSIREKVGEIREKMRELKAQFGRTRSP
jgi:hypothetical protein